jgi:glycosyltransferase involved in cell wall biosynthesis
MPSVHVTRWIENLKDTDHDMFWFDVMNRGEIKTKTSIHQIIKWRKRKIPYIKGEYWLSKNHKNIYTKIQSYLEVTANEQLELIIKEINPDIIHSFEMQECSYPIVKTMNKYPNINWLYSCWGSDLYYFKDFKEHRLKIKQVLDRINFLHTDCMRDVELAKQLGFKGKHLGVIPGGAGYKLDEFEVFKLPFNTRKIILIKGYEHLFGRALNVIKALEQIKDELRDYELVVFGAHENVITYIKEHNLPINFYSRHELSHTKLMELMGKSLVYIGNSISDGMPNTLLEAIIMGVFPIQSNPGGVTEEIIINNSNGCLIENPEDIDLIKKKILHVLENKQMIKKALELNTTISKNKLDFKINHDKIVEIYNFVNK